MSKAFRLTVAATVQSCKEGKLPESGAAAIEPHQQPGPPSPHFFVAHPQELGPESFPLLLPSPPVEQYHRSHTHTNSRSLHVGVIDWQHTTILPPILLANIPERIQNYNEHGSQFMTQLLENWDDIDEAPAKPKEGTPLSPLRSLPLS